MKSLIECVGLCNADSTKCNSVFFMKQNLICKLANLLSYKVSNTNKAMSGELAYIQTSKLQDKKLYIYKKIDYNFLLLKVPSFNQNFRFSCIQFVKKNIFLDINLSP